MTRYAPEALSRTKSLVFRGGLAAAGATAPPESRAEVLSGYFLAGYLGLSVPVVGLGIATSFAPTLEVMLIFAVIVAIAVTTCTRAVLAETRPEAHHTG
jgi:hypothetical protein